LHPAADARRRHRSEAPHLVAKRPPVEPFHDEIGATIGQFATLEDRGPRTRAQRSQVAALVAEPPRELELRPVALREDLADHDPPTQVRLVDRGGAAGAHAAPEDELAVPRARVIAPEPASDMAHAAATTGPGRAKTPRRTTFGDLVLH